MKLGPTLIGAIVGGVVGVAADLVLETVMNVEAGWFAIVVGVLTGLGARAMAGDALKSASYLRAGLVALIALAAIVGANYAVSKVVLNKNLAAYEMASAQPLPNIEQDTEVEGEAQAEPEAGQATTEEGAEAAEETESAATTDEAADADDQGDEEAEADADSAEADAEAAESETAEESADQEEAEDAAETKAERPAPAATVVAVDIEELAGQVPEKEIPTSPWEFAFFGIGTFVAYELARGGAKQA